MSCETMTTTFERSSRPRSRALAFVEEGGVAGAERLVDQEDVGLDLGRDREGQPHVHAAGVVLQRQLGELAQAGELVDPLDLGLHLAAA